MYFVTYTFAYVWCNPSVCFEKVIRLNNVWLRLDYVCHTFRTNPMSGLYVWIRFVQQCRETQKGKKITTLSTALLLVYCLRASRSSLRHLVLNEALHYVWLRLRYVSITFESTRRIPGNKVAQEPPSNSKDSP